MRVIGALVLAGVGLVVCLTGGAGVGAAGVSASRAGCEAHGECPPDLFAVDVRSGRHRELLAAGRRGWAVFGVVPRRDRIFFEFPGPGQEGPVMATADLRGRHLRRLLIAAAGQWSWSPDGARMAFTRGDLAAAPGCPVWSLWVARADGSEARQLSPCATGPAWAPDSKHLAFYRISGASSEVVSTDVTSGASADVASSRGGVTISWTPHGRYLAFEDFVGSSTRGHPIVRVAEPIANSPTWTHGRGSDPAWTPSGNLLFRRPLTSGLQALMLDAPTRSSPRVIDRAGGFGPIATTSTGKLAYVREPAHRRVEVIVGLKPHAKILRPLAPQSGIVGLAWSRDRTKLLYLRQY